MVAICFSDQYSFGFWNTSTLEFRLMAMATSAFGQSMALVKLHLIVGEVAKSVLSPQLCTICNLMAKIIYVYIWMYID